MNGSNVRELREAYNSIYSLTPQSTNPLGPNYRISVPNYRVPGTRNSGMTTRPTTPAASRPTTPAASRPTTPAASRPTTPAAAQTGDKEKDMATWAKANPKLAAAAAERERTRGTSQTTNPLMRDHYDLYDIILSHLLGEGYVETPEAAEVIMVNMSEEWRESILEFFFEQFMTEGLPLAVMGQTSSYGPGLYGNRTASGQVLTPQTRGIAHRTLPLGSSVRLTVPGGKTVDTTVIDRGPYVGDRQADLTTQTTRDLGFPNYKQYGVRNIDVSPITKTKLNSQPKLKLK